MRAKTKPQLTAYTAIKSGLITSCREWPDQYAVIDLRPILRALGKAPYDHE